MSITVGKFLGRALGVAVIGAASIALAGCSLLGNLGDQGEDTSNEGVGENTDVFTIKVGDCLNDGAETETVSNVAKIDCAEPHDTEAYASINLPDGEYPGDQVLVEQADAACITEFPAFVGLPYEESVLQFSYYYPTVESWDSGDREVLCLVLELDASSNIIKTIGSLEGANR